MIDGHVHLERGPYTKEWVEKFIKQAQSMGITELFIVEHTHRFEEFTELYESIFKEDTLAKEQTEWFYQKPKLKLKEYIDLIEQMKQIEWPIKVKFGLEVCYFEGKEAWLKEKLNSYPWDFLIGSVHWIDGWGFDNDKIKWSWEKRDINKTYERYYDIMISLVNSKLFDRLAHPDSIKCFNFYPTISLTHQYETLAKVLKANNVKAEMNMGLHINYNHKELGTNKDLLRILMEHEVEIMTVSDAHRPEDVGKHIKEAIEILEKNNKK